MSFIDLANDCFGSHETQTTQSNRGFATGRHGTVSISQPDDARCPHATQKGYGLLQTVPLTHAATAALHVIWFASGLLLSQSVRKRRAQFLRECTFCDVHTDLKAPALTPQLDVKAEYPLLPFLTCPNRCTIADPGRHQTCFRNVVKETQGERPASTSFARADTRVEANGLAASWANSG